MIGRLIEFSVKNRFLVIFVVLLVGALGVRALQRLPIDAVPDVTNVQVQVLTNAPSLGPLEIEQFITFPVETVMSGLPHLEEVRSVSRFGVSAVTVVFEEGTDIYFARQLVSERLAAAREAIPEVYGTPEMGPISTGLGEIYQFEVRGDPACALGEPDTSSCYSAMELREILDWYVAYQLRSVKGVVEVNAFGGELKTYQVTVYPEQLASYSLGLTDVFEALRRNNQSSGGGYIVHDGEQRLIRGEGLIGTLDDLRDVVVAMRGDGVPIRVGEIGNVELAPMIRQGASTRDGRGEAVTAIVMMLLGENSREVSRAVHERIQAIAPTLPPGVTLETFYDRTKLVDRTIRTVITNLIEGGVLVIVVLLVLLGNLRGGLLVASAIPISMLAAFIAMRSFGISGNLMSLGALDFGLIVDGSVVMVEHIVHVLGRKRSDPAGVQETVIAAAKQVARPVTFAVAIIVLVYVPIFSLQGIEGKMFRPMALTVIFALLASLVLALTFMPAMAATLFRRGVQERSTPLFRWCLRVYEPALAWTSRRPWAPALAALALFLGAAGLTPLLGAEFIPRLDEGAIAIQAVRVPSVPLEESIEYTGRVERSLLANFPDEVETVVSRTGRPEIATDPMGVETSDIIVELRPLDNWTRVKNKAELVEAMREALVREVPGQNYLFSQPIELRTNELISGVRSDVAVKIYGEDLSALARIAQEVEAVLAEVPGAADIESEQLVGLPFLRVQVDRAALARYGVSSEDVTQAVAAVAGHPVGEVFEGQRRFALVVRWAPGVRQSVDGLKVLPIRAPNGSTVPLGELARLEFEDGPAHIGRENVQRRVAVMANVRGRDLSSFVAAAQEAVARRVALPPGYFVEWGGQFRNLQEATARLAIAVPAALILIFLLLYMTYGSLRPAWLIYLNVPLAAAGGLFALALRSMPLSISAGVGFIALFGVAVLNGVVLVSHIRELQAEGMGLREATYQGARDRLRPVLMTALVASLGFLPMAMATSAGAEVQRPLATVVIGGLVTATFLTLLVLPAVYSRWGGDVSQKVARSGGANTD